MSQNREIAVCSPLSSPGLFNPVSVGPAKNPAAGVPALTSSVGTSLSFVFLTLPAASRPRAHSRALCFSEVHAHSGAQVFSLVVCTLLSSQSQSGSSQRSGARVFSLDVHAFPVSQSQSVLLQVPVCQSGHCPVQVATASWHPSTEAPSAFCLSSDICAQIHGSPLPTSILSAGDVHL